MQTYHIKVVNHRITKIGEYIGRPSPLGNPFTHLKGNTRAEIIVASREEAVKRYEEWLVQHIQQKTPQIIAELTRLYALLKKNGTLELRCWCAPQACHGDVLKRVLEQALERELARKQT